MLALSSTTDSILVDLAGAVTTNQLRCVATWRDITTTGYTPGRSVTLTNNTTAVDLVAPPAASTQRVIDFLSVYNYDTAAATVTLSFDDNGTLYDLTKVTLAAGERLEYADGVGFQVLTSAGAVKQSINQGSNTVSSDFSAAVLASDVTNNNATANTIADVTGLSFPVTSGKKYFFRFIIQYTAAATTTGSRWSISGPGGTMRYRSSYSLTTTSETVNSGLNAHDLPAAASASSAATGANTAIVEGHYEASANGSVIARFASEISSSAIVAKAGSVVYYQEVQ